MIWITLRECGSSCHTSPRLLQVRHELPYDGSLRHVARFRLLFFAIYSPFVLKRERVPWKLSSVIMFLVRLNPKYVALPSKICTFFLLHPPQDTLTTSFSHCCTVQKACIHLMITHLFFKIMLKFFFHHLPAVRIH